MLGNSGKRCSKDVFTDSVSELYAQRLYFLNHSYISQSCLSFWLFHQNRSWILFSHVPATCPAHIILDLMILITSGTKFWGPLLTYISPVRYNTREWNMYIPRLTSFLLCLVFLTPSICLLIILVPVPSLEWKIMCSSKRSQQVGPIFIFFLSGWR
jgi:hypothetical protein